MFIVYSVKCGLATVKENLIESAGFDTQFTDNI